MLTAHSAALTAGLHASDEKKCQFHLDEKAGKEEGVKDNHHFLTLF
jgi:hypothetical protein